MLRQSNTVKLTSFFILHNCKEKFYIKQLLSDRVWDWKSKSSHTMYEWEMFL